MRHVREGIASKAFRTRVAAELRRPTAELPTATTGSRSANGSGKTSVLEAIHLLGLARSFRSARLLPVIQYEQLACTVFGQVELAEGGHSSLGISRDRGGEFQIRIDGQNARSAAQLAEILPLQLINPDSFRLLEGAPKIRRQFLDWGVFHVEPRFMATWHSPPMLRQPT